MSDGNASDRILERWSKMRGNPEGITLIRRDPSPMAGRTVEFIMKRGAAYCLKIMDEDEMLRWIPGWSEIRMLDEMYAVLRDQEAKMAAR